MFREARIRLTIWYVIISMVISAVFSLAIFLRLQRDFDSNQKRYELRIRQLEPFDPNITNRLVIQQEEMSELEDRLILNLLLINAAVLGLSALAGYFLAGKTLEPIQEMVHKQNRFVADASHELRTPLTAMKTSIEVNLRDKKLDATSAKKVLLENLHDVDSMRQLSDDLLSLARLQENGTSQFKTVSLKKIIEESINIISHLAKEKNIVIEKSLKELSVFGDKERLVELFTIFLDNAVKYSEAKSKIAISTMKQGPFAEITIKDQGMGISEQDQEHIFERFYRADKSRSRTHADGYGLGLAIAKDIIDSHKGTVSVHSRLKKGTQFIIKLPLK